jgi:DNA-binding transcriptional MocR family regulator
MKDAIPAADVARQLRAEIIGGDYDEERRVPSRTHLKERFGISLESASVVLRMLAAEGWITLEQGRGSFIRPRRPYTVTLDIPRPAGVPAGAEVPGALLDAVVKAAEDEPAAYPGTAAAGALGRGAGVPVVMRVTAASAPHAAAIAYDVTAGARGWSWSGWDLTGASVHVTPE